ncbi:MAG TPA: Crp/Fnr family transcriptional regulator [Anaerolineales bacterium]|nr:Crp/Fnr family transcriptional regulator [Anaerolineales bacterium]
MKTLEANLNVKLNTLRRNPYFDELPDEMLKEIAGHMQLRGFERGEILFWEGDPCAGLHIIEEGSVKLYRISPQGRQYIIRVLQEGETCNEVPAFDGGTNPVNVETLEKSKVWVVDAETLRELVKAHPDFALKVLSNFGKNLRALVRMVSEMAFYQVTNRLARLISELPVDEARPPWTQEQLAAQLGTVREVVARSLKELERSGAIRIEDRRIHIADQDALSQWTQPYEV